MPYSSAVQPPIIATSDPTVPDELVTNMSSEHEVDRRYIAQCAEPDFQDTTVRLPKFIEIF
ncbi:MAG: hypothetical protein ABR555_11580 [Pyrinomonadaceae bacterium]